MFEVTVPEVFRNVKRLAKVWNLMQELNVSGPVKMQRPNGTQAGVGLVQMRKNGGQNVLSAKVNKVLSKKSQAKDLELNHHAVPFKMILNSKFPFQEKTVDGENCTIPFKTDKNSPNFHGCTDTGTSSGLWCATKLKNDSTYDSWNWCKGINTRILTTKCLTTSFIES